MSTAVPARYAIDETFGADEFAPDKIIGQRAEEIDRWIQNNTHLWSWVNQRRILQWGDDWAPIVIADAAYAICWVSMPFVSHGRSRYELWTDAEDVDIRMIPLDRTGVPVGSTVVHSHGAGRTKVSSNSTGNTTDQALLMSVEARYNSLTNPRIYAIRIRERHILVADLYPVLPNI